MLTAQREKLDAERLKLVQAHYADAIPLDLLKSEQDHIRTSLDAINSRLDNLANTYHSAHEGHDQIVGVLTDLGDLYRKCEPAERRILNRALFKRIVIDEDDTSRSCQPNRRTRSSPRSTGARRLNRPEARNCPAIRRGEFRFSHLTWR